MEFKVEQIPNKSQSRRISVFWKTIKIGNLIKDEAGYAYRYDLKGLEEAQSQGYSYLIGFKNPKKIYQSDSLFPVFSSRIPSRQRREIADILNDLGLETYDELALLLASQGRTNTDEISLVEDIDPRINAQHHIKEVRGSDELIAVGAER